MLCHFITFLRQYTSSGGWHDYSIMNVFFSCCIQQYTDVKTVLQNFSSMSPHQTMTFFFTAMKLHLLMDHYLLWDWVPSHWTTILYQTIDIVWLLQKSENVYLWFQCFRDKKIHVIVCFCTILFLAKDGLNYFKFNDSMHLQIDGQTISLFLYIYIQKNMVNYE